MILLTTTMTTAEFLTVFFSTIAMLLSIIAINQTGFSNKLERSNAEKATIQSFIKLMVVFDDVSKTETYDQDSYSKYYFNFISEYYTSRRIMSKHIKNISDNLNTLHHKFKDLVDKKDFKTADEVVYQMIKELKKVRDYDDPTFLEKLIGKQGK